MYNHQEYTANYPDSFKLNLRILSDALSDRFSDIRIKAESDLQCLCGIRIFQMGKALFSKYIYLIPASQITKAICYYDHANFLIAGSADLSEFSDSAHILCVGEESDFPEILNLVQQTFEKYQNWDKQLQNALQSPIPSMKCWKPVCRFLIIRSSPMTPTSTFCPVLDRYGACPYGNGILEPAGLRFP